MLNFLNMKILLLCRNIPYCFFKHFIYLFLAVLGLHCCVRFFFSCRVGATLQLWCDSFSLWWHLLWSMGSRAHRLSCSTACGTFLDQGLNPCLLHWQVDSLPLSHHGSPRNIPLFLRNISENV